MASKWEHLKNTIPEAPASDMTSAADEKFLPKVDAKKAELSTLTLPELMTKLLDCNAEWDEIEDRKKALNVEFEALGQLIYKNHFQPQGITNAKGVNGKTFYLQVEPLVSIKKGQRQDAEAWVEADPARDYLWSIHPQSLASWVKASLEKLEDEKTADDKIPDFVDVLLKTSVRVR